MAETRVIPSGKVYRQMFDAQSQLSRSLHDTRRRRVVKDGLLPDSGESYTGRNYDSGPQQRGRAHTGTKLDSDDMARDQLFSGVRPCHNSDEQTDEEEIRGLPDVVEATGPGSDIIQRLTEKKQRDHGEGVAQLQQDLTVLSREYEALFRKTGQDLLPQLSVHDQNRERHMQRIDSLSDLEKFTLQEFHDLWDRVREESETRRSWIRELDSTLTQYESERTAMIAALLRKYTGLLEKISYVMPSDVHRLIHQEAMMINQALLANRRAVAQLFLHLMEQDLQKELFHRQRWEDRLQDWRRVRVLEVVTRFNDFMGSPPIQKPPDVQTALESMRAEQLTYSQERYTVLQSVSGLIPPECSKSLVTDWYNSLSSVNQRIDCVHIDSLKKLHSFHERTWQECLAQVDHYKEEIATYGLSAEEVQAIVNTEFLPVIGRCQSQTEEHLAAMDSAFEGVARGAGLMSRSVFRVCLGASHLWEGHGGSLQRREQQLQEQLDEVRHAHSHEIQKKEAHLDLLLDKLRQESTEEALRATLEKTLHCLDEIKHGYMQLHREEVEVVDNYPAMVLEELQLYSSAVSHFFNVRETYSLGPEELHSLCPVIRLDPSGRASVKRRRQLIGSGKKRGPGGTQKSSSPGASLRSLLNESSPHLELSDPRSSETFVTGRGRVYSGLGWACPAAEAGHQDSGSAPDAGPRPPAQPVAFPNALVCQLLTDVRLSFFNHLEAWFEAALGGAMTVLADRKEALLSEHDLRLHLHQPRPRRIEMDVHNARAAELVQHSERVERHCKGVLQALVHCRTDLQELQRCQNQLTDDFRTHVHGMEDVFASATKSDLLVALCRKLQAGLEEHMEAVQSSQRTFRQTLENRLEALRQGNAQLLTSFKLFSEGGNFTPKEVEVYHKRLEKVTKRVEATEEAILPDMDGSESKCLEQAKDIVNRFEEKFRFLAVDLKFLERIQGLLSNTQVQIKSEATKSNMHKRKISGLLVELEKMVDACEASRGSDTTSSPEDVFTFTWSVLEELKARCQYLDCFLDPSMAVPLPDCPLQGSFALAARPKSRKQDKTGSPSFSDGLLQPSRMGVAFTEDAAVGVVRGLLRFTKPTAPQESHTEAAERGSGAAAVGLPSAVGSDQRPGKTHSQTALDSLRRSAESASAHSVKRFSKPTRFDKRFQVFGSKPEEEQGAPTFRSAVASVLWKTNDVLLLVAEDFYKRKERRPITRPQYLQETFEQCAEELNKRLLAYHSQAQDYHNDCLQEFRKQLQDFEECLSRVPDLLVGELGRRHLDSLGRHTATVRQGLQRTLQASEDMKREHSRKLSVRLSHPACEAELQALIRAEEDRQGGVTEAIRSVQLELEASVRTHGEEFVAALASSTENLLFQMDSLLTVDQVQTGKAEVRTENVTSLLRRQQAGALHEPRQTGPQVPRGSRTWPGIAHLTPPDAVTKTARANAAKASTTTTTVTATTTASITTAKTTLGHLRAVEARDAAYQRFEQRYREELEKAEGESLAQQREVQRWAEHWRGLLTSLTLIHAE